MANVAALTIAKLAKKKSLSERDIILMLLGIIEQKEKAKQNVIVMLGSQQMKGKNGRIPVDTGYAPMPSGV